MVSVVIPIYNNAVFIFQTVEAVSRAMERLYQDYEIVMHDDGSGDGSQRVLQDVHNSNARVRVAFNERNRGLGYTLRALFANARGETVIYSDCDLPFGTEVFAALLKEMREADIVVASRYLTPDGADTVEPVRRLASRAYYQLCRRLWNIPVVDIGSGTVAFRKELLGLLPLQENGFVIHAEIFVEAARLNARIHEIPLPARSSGKGSFLLGRHGWEVVRDTLRLYGRLKKEK